jgi:ABC-type glycerol-3-phosphate transport system permease component
MSKTPAFYLGKTATYAILIIGSITALIPMLWAISTSLKTIDQLSLFPPRWIPDPIAWGNYPQVFQTIPVLQYFGNTMVIVTAWVIGGTITCSFVAYGFARTQFWGRDTLFLILLSTLMMPYICLLYTSPSPRDRG